MRRPAQAVHRRLHRLRAEPEQGLTLTELLVAVVLLSLIMTMVVAFFSGANKAFNLNQTIDTNMRTASNVMGEMSKTLRAATNNPLAGSNTPAPAFVQASATSVTFYAYVNLESSEQTPKQVRFSLNTTNNTIVETTWAATALAGGLWSFPAVTTTPTSTRILGGPLLLAASGGPQVFTYLTGDGTVVPFASTGSIPTTTVANIASVQVAVTLGSSSDAGKNVALSSIVGLPNLGIARTN